MEFVSPMQRRVTKEKGNKCNHEGGSAQKYQIAADKCQQVEVESRISGQVVESRPSNLSTLEGRGLIS